MNVDIKITGLDEVMVQLRNVAKVVPDHARRTMHNVADKIVDLAKLQTPVDKGNLEESIHKEVKREDNRRLAIDIVAGGTVNGVNVDEYAALIHENYSSMGTGKNTQAKMAANPGVLIGEKFLERAYDKYQPQLEKMMITDISKDTDKKL